MIRFKIDIFSIVILYLLFAIPNEARADWKWDAVQITCDKDLNYFVLRTLVLEDVMPKDAEAAKRVQQKSGIYDITTLLQHPYTCELPNYKIVQGKTFPARKVSVEIVDYQGAKEHGMCGGVESYNILVSSNGKKIAKYWINNCSQSDGYLIELDTFNRSDTCILSHDFKEQKPCN